LESCTPGFGLDDAQIDLKRVRDPDAHLGIASDEDFLDRGKLRETVHDLFGCVARDQDVQVADSLFATTVAPREFESLDFGSVFEMLP
jgi:hypothetical protein